MSKLLWMQGVYLGNNGRIWEKLIVASATAAHKPHAELDSIYQGQKPKGKSVLVFQRSKLLMNIVTIKSQTVVQLSHLCRQQTILYSIIADSRQGS